MDKEYNRDMPWFGFWLGLGIALAGFCIGLGISDTSF